MNFTENQTTTSQPIFEDFHELHCPKDALTDLFGWLAQGLLAVVAFSSLVGEFSRDRRASWIFFSLTKCLQSSSETLLRANLQTSTMGDLVVRLEQADHRIDSHSHGESLHLANLQGRSVYLVRFDLILTSHTD